MEFIRNSSEAEMILEFLNGELNSKRFNGDLLEVLNSLKLDTSIITHGDTTIEAENQDRLKIMKEYRGYPDEKMFENFPKVDKWGLYKLSAEDINKIFYINYDYWNELSNNTSNPLEAAKNIQNGVEVYDVSNKQYFDGVKFLENNKFSPVILITCDEEKYLIIEGHVRMTVYALNPTKLNDATAFIGICSSEEIKKYDAKMNGEKNE